MVLFTLIQAGDRTTRGTASDTASGVWNGIGTGPIDDSANTYALDRFLSLNHPGGVASVTYTPNSNSSGSVVAVEISGLKTASALDVHAGQLQATPTTGTDATTSGTASATAQPAAVIGVSANTGFSGTPAVGTGFTNVGTWATLFGSTIGRIEHKRITATGSQAATFTAAGNTAHLTAMMVLLEPSNVVTNKTMTETFATMDEALDPTYRVRQMSENMSLSDGEFHWARRYRLVSDSIDFVDSVIKTVVVGSGLFVKVMSDTWVAVDGAVQWLRRVRGPIDTTTLTDGDTYRTSLVTATETFETADGFVSWRRLRRLVEDNLDLIDGFSKIVAGAGITYARVLSDTVTLIDDAGQRWRLRVSQLTEAVGISDQVIQYLRRVRQLGDDVEYADGVINIRRFTRSFDEAIEISDGLVSTLYLDQMSNISFLFGSSAPPFRFGGL